MPDPAEIAANINRDHATMRYSHQSWGRWKPGRGRKPTKAQIAGAVPIIRQVKTESDRLRAQAGLKLVPLTAHAQAWIAELENGPTPRTRKSSPARVDVAPLDRVKQATSAIAAGRVAQLEAAREAIEQGASYAAIGRALGVSRQAAHKMLTLAAADTDGGS